MIIDAAGLGMLTAAHLRAERAGHRLVLRNCSDEVRRVLAVTHLNRVLHIDRRQPHRLAPRTHRIAARAAGQHD